MENKNKKTRTAQAIVFERVLSFFDTMAAYDNFCIVHVYRTNNNYSIVGVGKEGRTLIGP